MYNFLKYAATILSTATRKSKTPITIRTMESVLTIPTAWRESTVNKSRRGLMFSVLIFDTSHKTKAPMIINTNPMHCKHYENTF